MGKSITPPASYVLVCAYRPSLPAPDTCVAFRLVRVLAREGLRSIHLFPQIFGRVEIARHITEIGVLIVHVSEIQLAHFFFFNEVVVAVLFVNITEDLICIELLV